MAGLLTYGSAFSRTFPSQFGSVVSLGSTHRLQLRGQLRIRRVFALPHRIPFSFQPYVRRLETICGICESLSRLRQDQKYLGHILGVQDTVTGFDFRLNDGSKKYSDTVKSYMQRPIPMILYGIFPIFLGVIWIIRRDKMRQRQLLDASGFCDFGGIMGTGM